MPSVRRPARTGPAPASVFPLSRPLALLLAACALTGCLGDEPPRPIVTEGALTDVAYEPARRLVSRSCADCHAKDGNNRDHVDAWGHAIRLDTYKQWVDGNRVLVERLDPDSLAAQDPPVDPMPPAHFPYPLAASERDTLLEWMRRGSPNTADGLPLPE
jgi:hypothetical protein